MSFPAGKGETENILLIIFGLPWPSSVMGDSYPPRCDRMSLTVMKLQHVTVHTAGEMTEMDICGLVHF